MPDFEDAHVRCLRVARSSSDVRLGCSNFEARFAGLLLRTLMAKKHDDETGKFAAFEASDKEREIVSILAAEGIPQRSICRFVKREGKPGKGFEPISLATLKRHFREELKIGREVADATIVHKNYELMIAGNPQVTMFLAKARLGWKEVTEVHMRETYGDLVQQAQAKAAEREKIKLVAIQGGKPAEKAA